NTDAPPIGPPKAWRSWIQVVDAGLGMDASVIKNYFLKAGASFRKSDSWHKMFDVDSGLSKDAKTKPKPVFRSGRFGIGVLAAFLLGSEIQVLTRRLGEERGIEFTATIDIDNVELRFIDCPIGTTVRIRLDHYDL